MDALERTIVIDAPRERVWSVFSDIDGMPQRLDHIVSTERLGGPLFDVGTRWRHREEIRPELYDDAPPERAAPNGPAQGGVVAQGPWGGGPASVPTPRPATRRDPILGETVAEIVGCDPPNFFVIEATSPLGPCTTGYAFENGTDGASTTVRAILQLRPAGVLGRVTTFFFGRAIEKGAARSIEVVLSALKTACERPDPPGLRN